jgi:DNA-binding LytR/AlgR family response regulator
MKVKIICEKSKYEHLKHELQSKGIEVVEDSELILIDTSSNNNQIRINSKGEIVLIDPSSIIALESFDHDIYIYLLEEEIVTKTPLKEVKKLLNDSFIQISQSVIINKHCIKRIKNVFKCRFIVIMKNNKEFVVTKTYYYKFIEELNL